MISFITTTLFRAFSGIKNSHYYKYANSKPAVLIIASIEMAILCFFVSYDLKTPLSLITLLPIIPLIILVVNMLRVKTQTVHFYENLIQYTWMLTALIAGADIIGLLIGAYIGNVLFNAIIQYYKGSTIWQKQVYKKTELIQIGKLKINKPRISNGYFLTLSALLLGLGYIAFWSFTQYSLTIYDLFGPR